MSPPTKDYFLLYEPVHGDRLLDLLGRAVHIHENSLKRPTESKILPELPGITADFQGGPDLKAFVPGLYPKHIKAENVEVLLNNARNESTRLSISRVLDLFYNHHRVTEREQRIPSFRRITMEQQSLNIERLLQKPDYSGPILEIFEKDPGAKLGVIVSIISCFDMEIGNKKSRGHEGGISTAAPGDGLGAPGVDIKAEAKASSSNSSELTGAYEGEVIMACAYVEMRLKENPNKGWLSFLKSNKLSIYDITVTKQGIYPKTMTVSVPPTRIEGDQEAILGAIAEGEAEAVAKEDKRNNELDFVVHE